MGGESTADDFGAFRRDRGSTDRTAQRISNALSSVVNTTAILCTFCPLLVTGRICRRQLCRYCFYSRARPIFGFFAPQGRHVAPIKVKFGMEEPLLHAKFHLDRSRGGGLRPPKLEKNWNFTNIIAPKLRVPCTILQNL